MSNLTELAMDLRMKGISVDSLAKELNVTTSAISMVNAGKRRNARIEKKYITLGCGYLLKKIQLETGIFNQERYDRLVEEVKNEK